MTQWLRTLNTLVEDQSSVANMQAGSSYCISNFSFRGSNSLFWLHEYPHMRDTIHIDTQIKKQKILPLKEIVRVEYL